MSAINMVCAKCGGHYIAGMVGTWIFPAHVCPNRKDLSPLGGGPKP